jgi:ribonuclease PH
MLALLDAGVPLKNLVVATCCAVTKDSTLLIDPSIEEEKVIETVLLIFLRMLRLCLHLPSIQTIRG